MTIHEIIQRIKDIKGNYVNGDINSEDMVEAMEDLIHDVEGNDGLSWDAEHYEDFEETDFTKLEI